ncbi:MAG: IS110 family transposase, partial [Sulfurospirillum sp.]|nr:IS110 family transposase [Sulfurospirillum sp.]
RQHITALCGLDPIQRSSGTSVQHKERISKQGLSLVRAILFMPTMAAIQHNKEMKLTPKLQLRNAYNIFGLGYLARASLSTSTVSVESIELDIL